MENSSMTTGMPSNKTMDGYFAPVLPEWSLYLFIVTNVIIMVLGVLGNGIILLVEQFNKQKTSTDWMIMFMAVNDFILAGFNTPIIILMYGGSWTKVGSDALCGFMFYVQETLSYSSTLLLTVTAIDRYMKTCRPLTIAITPKRSLCTCLGITAFTILFSVPIPLYVRYDDAALCRYHITSAAVSSVFKVTLYLIQATYVAMFLIVIFSYCKIGLTIRNRQRKILRTVQPYPLVSHDTADTSSRIAQKRNTQSTSVSQIDAKYSESDKTGVNTDHNIKYHLNRDASGINQPGTSQNDARKTNNNIPTAGNNTSNKNEKRHTQNNNRMAYMERQSALKQAQMNKTTVIMFAVTLVFILSWIPTWANSIVWPKNKIHSEADYIAALFCRRAFMINTCTNPFFYIGMSSLFRKLTKETMAKIWRRLRNRFNG